MAAPAAARVAGVPAVRLSSRLQLAVSFIPQQPPASSSTTHRGGRRRRGRSAAGAPAAQTADVRVVIRRHFPVAGPRGGARIVQEVAEDIALRSRPARELGAPSRVARALTEDVLPLVAHPFDRGAVAAAGAEICARVAAACADERVDAGGGVRVLVLVDTFACPVVPLRRPRPPPCNKPVMWSGGAAGVKDAIARADEPCTGLDLDRAESGLPAVKERPRHVGVIGDRRLPKPVDERFQGWLPW
ncbi:unnamed protein product [Urochloa humidicola]